MSTANDDLFEEILRFARILDDDERLSVHVSFSDKREQLDGFGATGGTDSYVAWIQGTVFKSSGATSTMALLELKNLLIQKFDKTIEYNQKKIAEAEASIQQMKDKIGKFKRTET